MSTNIYTKLANVQKELVVPKGKKNQFGGFCYRSVEDILVAVKPICLENGLLLTLSDDVQEKNGNYYICSTAVVTDMETEKFLCSTGWARDPLEKKGMDAAQVTGTSSSYARKRALGGLFLIDDEVDTDSLDNREEGNKARKEENTARKKDIARLQALCEERGIGIAQLMRTLFDKEVNKCSDNAIKQTADRFDAAYQKYVAIEAAKSEEIPL